MKQMLMQFIVDFDRQISRCDYKPVSSTAHNIVTSDPPVTVDEEKINDNELNSKEGNEDITGFDFTQLDIEIGSHLDGIHWISTLGTCFSSLESPKALPSFSSIVKIGLLVTLIIILPLISWIRFRYQTGAWLLQDYDFYSSKAGTLHRFPILPYTNYTDVCPSHTRRELPSFAELEPSFNDILFPSPSLSSLDSSSLTDNTVSPTQHISPPPPTLVYLLKLPNKIDPAIYRQQLENFDFIWITILGYHRIDDTFNETIDERNNRTSQTENYKISNNRFIHIDEDKRLFPSSNIEIRYIEFPKTKTFEEDKNFMQILPLIRNLIIITDWSYYLDVLKHFLTSPYLNDKSIGIFTITEETCSLGDIGIDESPYSWNDNIKFIFMTYGDCKLVDNIKTFILPLGPARYEGKFDPSLFNLIDPYQKDKQIIKRDYLLSLMVSFTLLKPTRMQALLGARELCENWSNTDVDNSNKSHIPFHTHNCYIPGNPTALTFLTERFFPQYAWDHYNHIALSSITTLVPVGNNPYTFRLYESIMTGSIPLVETLDSNQLPTSQNAAFGPKFRCSIRDIFEVEKFTDAPFYWVTDWKSDLKKIFELLKIEGIEQRQKRMSEWWHYFRHYLQNLILKNIQKSMK